MSEVLEFDLAWGGYYACTSTDSKEISVIRLLDFNRDCYHASLFNETFNDTPSLETVERLSLFVGHVPIDARGLLNSESINLIGWKPLTESDLEGYMYYLSEFEVTDGERKELTDSLIEFSNNEPLALTLYLSDGELQIKERV